MTNFIMDQSDLKTKIWHLVADKAILAEEKNRAYLTNPHMLFYKNNLPDTKVKSKTGVVQTETHDVVLSTDVVAVSLSDNNQLYTSQLFYSAASHQFLTHKKVKVVRPSGTTYGRGLKATEDLSQIKIYHQQSFVKSSGDKQ